MYTHNGRTIQANKAWTSDDGYQHPANWNLLWSDDDKTKWEVTWTNPPVVKSFDDRFYWDADTPRSLTDVEGKDSDGNDVITLGLKNQYIKIKKDEANDLLSKTDWYIVRKQEKDTAIPSSVSTDRDAIRTACAGIETKINNVSDLDAFMALFDKKDNGDPSDMDCY